jgi:hypothetical protein
MVWKELTESPTVSLGSEIFDTLVHMSLSSTPDRWMDGDIHIIPTTKADEMVYLRLQTFCWFQCLSGISPNLDI